MKDKLSDYNGAIEDYKKTIKLCKYSPDAYFNMGLSNYKLGNYEQAVDNFTTAIEQNPNYSMAYYKRGQTYLKLDNQQFAKSDFEQACKLNPANKNFKQALEEIDSQLKDMLKKTDFYY